MWVRIPRRSFFLSFFHAALRSKVNVTWLPPGAPVPPPAAPPFFVDTGQAKGLSYYDELFYSTSYTDVFKVGIGALTRHRVVLLVRTGWRHFGLSPGGSCPFSARVATSGHHHRESATTPTSCF